MTVFNRLEDDQDNRLDRLVMIHTACFERPWAPSDFHHRIKSPAHEIFCLSAEDQTLIGFVVFSVVLDEAEIETVAIDPAYQNRGHARTLLEKAFAALSTRSVTRVFLEVSVANRPALALYQGLSFHISGTRKAYYHNADGNKEDAYTMTRTLGI